MPGDRRCRAKGCARPHHALGWCSLHYNRLRRNGSLVESSPRYRWPENLLRRLRFDPDGCVRFTGALVDGYGMVKRGGKMTPAHRAMYELMIGPIPEGRDLDHLCHNRDQSCPGGACPHRACVNPAHLDPVSHQENCRRSSVIGRAKPNREDHP